jgi:hypothetical protein
MIPFETDLVQYDCQHPYKYVKDILQVAGSHGKMEMHRYYLRAEDPITPEYGYGGQTSFVRYLAVEQLNSSSLSLYLQTDGMRVNKVERPFEIGISSTVTSRERPMGFVPVIDFKDRPSLKRLNEICVQIANEKIHGATYKLYDSGNSYHAYFKFILPHSGITSFLRHLARYPEIDQAWVAYALQRRACIMRWTAISGTKSPIREIDAQL